MITCTILSKQVNLMTGKKNLCAKLTLRGSCSEAKAKAKAEAVCKLLPSAYCLVPGNLLTLCSDS